MTLCPEDYGVEDLPAEGLSEVSAAARALSDAYADKQKLEQLVKINAARILKLETEELPAALRVLGVEELTLSNGEKISVKEEVGVGITEANREAAYAWLREHGAASLIKRLVAVQFGRGEDAAAAELIQRLREQFEDNPVIDKEDVHYQTLKSYVKERLAAERDSTARGEFDPQESIPRALFGIFTQPRATIKKPKTTGEIA